MQEKIQSQDFSVLDNISLTALRIILIFDMLLKGPCSDKDINRKLQEEIKDCRELSKDTICIYLNTLRILGCDISRPTRNNNYKYNLTSHPYNLSLSEKEVQTLIEIRKHVSNLCEWKTAVEIDELFDTIFKNSSQSTKKMFFSAKKIFLSREVSSEKFFQKVKQLDKYCKQSKTLTLVYKSPESGEKNITLTAEKITMENGAFYLWGYNEEKETSVYLRLDRIQSIKTVSLQESKLPPVILKAKYSLKIDRGQNHFLTDEDRIVEKTDDGLIIESTVCNKFRFLQKILSYGSDCTILHPQEIKDEIKENLSKILSVYDESGLVKNENKT